MTKRRNYQAKKTAAATVPAKPLCFAFGDPEPLRSPRLIDLLGVFPAACGDYYVPPVDLWGLSQMRYANGQHGSCIVFRRNMAANAYIGGGLSQDDFAAAAMDLLTFGQTYIQVFRNYLGKPVRIRHVPGLNMRVMTENRGYRMLRSSVDGADVDFPENEILMLKEYDTSQQIYGVPDWLGGMQSALLNQEATLFRRKYYINGAHLGYILYTSAADIDEEYEEAFKKMVRDGKGGGNFKTAYVNLPGAGKEGIQIIPIGDISQKDEFLNIKNVSANDVREAHRVPPVLMGIVPTGTSSLGDPVKVEKTYIKTEVKSICKKFMALNAELPPALQLKFYFPDDKEDSGE